MRSGIIGFNQKALVDLEINAKDIWIIDWFIRFKNTEDTVTGKPVMKQKQFNGKTYYWVKYDKVMLDLPFLQIKTKKAIYNIFKKLAEKQVLDKWYEQSKKGSYTYFKLGRKYGELIKGVYEEKKAKGGLEENFQPGWNETSNRGGTKLPTKDNKLKDNKKEENTTYSGESKDSLQLKTDEILNFWEKEIGRKHTSPKIKDTINKYLSNLLSGKPLLINKDGTTNKNISKLYSNLNIPKEIQFKKWKIEEIKEIIKQHDSSKERNLHHFFFSKNRSQIPYSYFYVMYLNKQEIDILPIYKTIANILCKIFKDNPSQKEIDTAIFEVRDNLYKYDEINPEKALKLSAWYYKIDGLNEKYITKFLTVSEFFDKFKRIEFNRNQFEDKKNEGLGTGDNVEDADWLKESRKLENI